jgi:hypothetical protein
MALMSWEGGATGGRADGGDAAAWRLGRSRRARGKAVAMEVGGCGGCGWRKRRGQVGDWRSSRVIAAQKKMARVRGEGTTRGEGAEVDGQR